RFQHNSAKERKHINHTYLRRFKRKVDEVLREWAYRCEVLIRQADEQGTRFPTEFQQDLFLSGLP
ncbi:hypothetical protein SARC_12907, partial [Sphaeroforma arctica JP610]